MIGFWRGPPTRVSVKLVYPIRLTGLPGGARNAAARPALIAGFAAPLGFWIRALPRRHSGAGSGPGPYPAPHFTGRGEAQSARSR
jgi:hypothetical protein